MAFYGEREIGLFLAGQGYVWFTEDEIVRGVMAMGNTHLKKGKLRATIYALGNQGHLSMHYRMYGQTTYRRKTKATYRLRALLG